MRSRIASTITVTYLGMSPSRASLNRRCLSCLLASAGCNYLHLPVGEVATVGISEIDQIAKVFVDTLDVGRFVCFVADFPVKPPFLQFCFGWAKGVKCQHSGISRGGLGFYMKTTMPQIFAMGSMLSRCVHEDKRKKSPSLTRSGR